MSDAKPKKSVSNWQKLKGKLVKEGVIKPKKVVEEPEPVEEVETNESKKNKKQKERESNVAAVKSQSLRAIVKSKYVGLDCEMVGLGLNGKESALARACCVDFDGNAIYDKFVRPKGFVTDFRTQWSGVRKKDLRQGQAISFEECQREVADILKNKILVGHALKNDLDVLMLSHPRQMIRDTAKYKPYMRVHGRHGKMRPRALRDLTAQYLGIKIQGGEHDPAEDANSAMTLYRHKMDEWETGLKDSRLKAKLAVMEKQKTGSTGTGGDKKSTGKSDGKSSIGGNVSIEDGVTTDQLEDNEDNNEDNESVTSTSESDTESEEEEGSGPKMSLSKFKEIPEMTKAPKSNKPTTVTPVKSTVGVKRKVVTSMFGNDNVFTTKHTPSTTPTNTPNSSKGSEKKKSLGGVSFEGGSIVMNKKVGSIADVDRVMADKKKMKR